MDTLTTLGGLIMLLAALSLTVLGVDFALRHGGEGMLIGLGLCAGAILPAGIAATYLGAPYVTTLTCLAYYAALLVALLAVLAVILMPRGEQGGIICLGIAFIFAAGIYAIAPGYIAAQRQTQAQAAKG